MSAVAAIIAVLILIVFDETRLIIYSPLWNGVIIDILFVGWALLAGSWRSTFQERRNDTGDLSAEDLEHAPGVGTMLAACTVLVAFAMYAVVQSYMEHAPVVQYGSSRHTAARQDALPGDNLTYDQRFVVDAGDVPAVLEVDEGWYSASRGVVLRSTTNHYRLPLVRPYDLTTTVTRTVPALTPACTGSTTPATNGPRPATVGRWSLRTARRFKVTCVLLARYRERKNAGCPVRLLVVSLFRCPRVVFVECHLNH